MKKLLFSKCAIMFILLFVALNSFSQYYYKDIVSINQANKEFSYLKNSSIKLVKLKSFEDNDEPSEGFFCEKKINKTFMQSEMISKSYITGQSLLVTDYSPGGQITKTTNTTPTTSSTASYRYNDKNQVTEIITVTSADGDSSSITERHTYMYDEKGDIVKMERSKNSRVIGEILFKYDAKGNIIEEDPSGIARDKKYFYYYDDHNRLTDIVHYNDIAHRLLPDYMFEYNSKNLVRQMITIDESGRNYFIWKYSYTDTNLPEIQKCFSKEKRLLGTIEFEYK
ncbi:MAG: hypothetical protein ABIR31_10300 [Ginsengibacter sp.]